MLGLSFCTLYSGLGIMAGSHSPSMSSSQSSGFLASGSGMFSGCPNPKYKVKAPLDSNLRTTFFKYCKDFCTLQLSQLKAHLRFCVFRIVNFRPVVPILWLLGLGILDLFWRKEIPVFLKRTRFYFLVVDFDFVRLVWPQDQCIQVREFIILTGASRRTKLQQL